MEPPAGLLTPCPLDPALRGEGAQAADRDWSPPAFVVSPGEEVPEGWTAAGMRRRAAAGVSHGGDSGEGLAGSKLRALMPSPRSLWRPILFFSETALLRYSSHTI